MNATPRLAPGEKGTGDILKGLAEPFALVGEQATDWDRVKAEKAAAARLAREAREIAARQQNQFFWLEGGR